MANAPPRPASLDERAEWHDHTGEWRLGDVDGEGRLHGTLQTFRADGTLCAEHSFVHGTLHGPFRRFHPNGELARSGVHADGRIEGEVVATACDQSSPERLRACCVPPGAWTLRADYDAGQLQRERFFDRAGRLLLPDGSIHPERPDSVPPTARFVPELARRWMEGEYQRGQRQGRWRFWSETGELLVDSEYAAGQAVGRWTLHTEGLTRDLGRELVDLKSSPALVDERKPPEHWAATYRALSAERRPAEALCALARAGDVAALKAALARDTLVRTAAGSEQLAQELSGASTPERVANALLLGAAPSLVLQRLTRWLPARSALDLIDAALALDPERRELYTTRATLRLGVGDVEGAQADLARDDSGSLARSALAGFIQALFWPFEFWPAHERLGDQSPEELPDTVEQPLAAVVSAIQKCALRVTEARRALLAGGAPLAPWLPPDLSALYAGTTVELGRWQFEIEEDGQPVQVVVDETLPLAGLDVPALMRRAQRDHAALCWICWGVGLDEVALPGELRPRPELRRALATGLLRYWVCQDRLQTSGLRARMQGVPGFRWRGLANDELHGPIAELAGDAYSEMRAALFWLADPECQSLWQDDLRPR